MGSAAPASAKPIPPTRACQVKLKKLFKVYFKEISGSISDEEEQAADNRVSQKLAAAGCVSDVEPLLGDVTLTPHSSECVSAAAYADRIWSPRTRRIDTITRNFKRKVADPMGHRIARINRRLANRGKPIDSAQEFKRLITKRFTLRMKLKRLNEVKRKRITRAGARKPFANFLILYEFISLRCVGLEFLGKKLNPGEPVASVVKANREVIFQSLYRAIEISSPDYFDFEVAHRLMPDAT